MEGFWQAMRDIITWERFLVLWGLITPAIAWFFTRRWERANQERDWSRRRQELAEEREREEKRRLEDLESAEREHLHERMRDSYTRFLKGASALGIAAALEFGDQKRPAVGAALPDFTLAFQQLLLVASNDAARAAVEVWKAAGALAEAKPGGAEVESLRQSLREARTRFLHAARKDLEDPVRRNANPGLGIMPAITIGGFHVQDAG